MLYADSNAHQKLINFLYPNLWNIPSLMHLKTRKKLTRVLILTDNNKYSKRNLQFVPKRLHLQV